jgi:phosphohistidine phosphatase
MNRLIVMRHSKAEQFAASDHDRVLAARGERDALAAGRWALAEGYLPDHVVVSSAARTRGTWDGFVAGSGTDVGATFDRALYAAGTDGALEIIRAAPPASATVMLVGHNPTMAYLVHLLDNGDADPEVFAQVSTGFPTSAICVLEVPGAWADLDIAGATIKAFHVARG